MASLAELKERAEIDDNNPFEAACWRAVERLYHQHNRSWSMREVVDGRYNRWHELMREARTAYEELQAAPTQEHLDALTILLDTLEKP
jgi:hypothetical protein